MIRAEVWKSSENKEEIHVFDGTNYVCGFNPRYIGRFKIQQLLRSVNMDLPPHEDEQQTTASHVSRT